MYGGFIDKFPMGALMNRVAHDPDRAVPRASLHEAAARAHRVRRIDPTFMITHRMPLEDAARGYDMFVNKHENCEKVILKAS